MKNTETLRIHNCTQIRKKLVKFGHLGVDGPVFVGEEWRIEPCDTPLFTDQERESGVCNSCRDGWSCDTNYPVTPDGSRIPGAAA